MSISPPLRFARFANSRPVPVSTSVGVSAIFSSLIAFNAEAMSAELSRGIETEMEPLSSEVATTAPNCIGACARGVSSILIIALIMTEGAGVGVAVGVGVFVAVLVTVLVLVGVGVLDGVADHVAVELFVGVAVLVTDGVTEGV